MAGQSAAREQATPGFPVGEATGALLVRSLMALVPNHRQRFVTGRAPLIRTPRTALGWGFITNSGTTEGYGSASYAVWSGFVILEEGSIYEISHAHGAVLGPSGLPNELIGYGGRFQRPLSSQWRMKGDALEAVQAQVAAWRAGQ